MVTGRDLFSSSLFRSAESTSVFYTFIAELKDIASRAHPTSTHQFIKKLDTTGRLLRSYTQNIDGLEKQAGLVCSSTVDGQSVRLKSTEATPSEPQPRPVKMEQTEAMSVPSYTSTGTFDKKRTKNVQLHGDLHRLRCNLCSGSYDFTDEYVKICREGLAPVCPACEIRGPLLFGDPFLKLFPLDPSIIRLVLICLFLVKIKIVAIEINDPSNLGHCVRLSSSMARYVRPIYQSRDGSTTKELTWFLDRHRIIQMETTSEVFSYKT